MRTKKPEWPGSPAAVLLGILLVAGALLGSCSAAAAVMESQNAVVSTASDVHEPVCAHSTPASDEAVADPTRRHDGAAPDGAAAPLGANGMARSAVGLRTARVTGTRGPPVAGRTLLECLGISRI